MLDRFFHYAFLNGRLIGSEHPGAFGSPVPVLDHFVNRCGVKVLISLTPAFQDFRTPALVQYHVPMTGTPQRARVAEAVGIIDRHLTAGERVWVHCQQGVDRTGCVIGSYLAGAGHAPDEVVTELYQRFPPHRRQPRMIALWAPYVSIIRTFSTTPVQPKL